MRPSRARVGTFQLTPTPPKKPFFACAVTPSVARVMFSVAETSGANDPSVARSVVPVIVAVSLDGTYPFNSAFSRTKLRDGNARPAPQRNAPDGRSKPSALPRHS